MDVKDTVHKAPLLLHLVELVVEKFPESSDLHSELCHVHFVAKVGLVVDSIAFNGKWAVFQIAALTVLICR